VLVRWLLWLLSLLWLLDDALELELLLLVLPFPPRNDLLLLLLLRLFDDELQ